MLRLILLHVLMQYSSTKYGLLINNLLQASTRIGSNANLTVFFCCVPLTPSNKHLSAGSRPVLLKADKYETRNKTIKISVIFVVKALLLFHLKIL